MTYWNSILDEVLQKEDDREFFYTNRGRLDDAFVFSNPYGVKKPPARRTYFLSPPFENIYFTSREAETAFWIIQEYTLSAAAHEMKLSPRTVEFYVKNMKTKLRCTNKKDMIEKILQTDLLQQLEKDGFKIMKH